MKEKRFSKYVYGMISRSCFNGKVFMKKSRLTVRITADKIGATLSISDDGSLQYSIALEDIKDELKELIRLGLL